MNTGKIPNGMTAVTPHLTVKDVDAAIEFYERVFGFSKKLAMPGPDGKTGHAELTHGSQVIMLGGESTQCLSVAPAISNACSSALYLYVENVDQLFATAKANGCRVKEEPTDMFWGDRTCGLVDPFGHHWGFATFVKEVSPEDCQKAVQEMQKKQLAHT